MGLKDLQISDAGYDPSWGRTILIGVALCLLMLGVVFRALAAGDFLWLDEQHTAWVAQADLAKVAKRAADGNQTPLFFYACWSAMKVGGESALSLRLPSLLCGLCLLAIVPSWVWRQTVSAASLLVVAAWFLFDYDAVFYASEARPYAMVQLLGVIQAAVFFAWISSLLDDEGGSRASWIGGVATGVLAALIFYTHPTGMLLMLAEVVFVLGLAVVHRGSPWRALLGTAALCALLILPGVIMIAFVWQRRENWTSVTDVWKVFSALAVQAALLMLLPAIAKLAEGLFSRRRSKEDFEATVPFWTQASFVACWAIIPGLMIVSLDSAGWVPLAIGRYAIVGSVAFPIFAALMIGRLQSGLLRSVVTLVIVSFLAWHSVVPWQLKEGGFRHENWKQVVEVINAEDDSLPVFLVANLIEDVAAESDQSERFQAYLGFPLKGIPRLNRPERIVPRPSQGIILSQENIAAMVDAGGGFVVVRDAEIYRDAIRLEITAVLQSHPLTQRAQLLAAPINVPVPNNVHVFWIKLNQKAKR